MFNIELNHSVVRYRDVARTPQQRLGIVGSGGRQSQKRSFCEPYVNAERVKLNIGMWRSLVAHLAWDEGVARSNRVIPTIKKEAFGASFFIRKKVKIIT